MTRGAERADLIRCQDCRDLAASHDANGCQARTATPEPCTCLASRDQVMAKGGQSDPNGALRRVKQERDYWIKEHDKAIGACIKRGNERDAATAELASARQELDAVRTARDNLDRQLALAHREVLELDAQIKLCPRCSVEVDAEVNGTDPPADPGWIVARDGGRDCARCGQEIRRGEAYELQDGTGGLLLHIHCPDREGDDHAEL